MRFSVISGAQSWRVRGSERTLQRTSGPLTPPSRPAPLCGARAGLEPGALLGLHCREPRPGCQGLAVVPGLPRSAGRTTHLLEVVGRACLATPCLCRRGSLLAFSNKSPCCLRWSVKSGPHPHRLPKALLSWGYEARPRWWGPRRLPTPSSLGLPSNMLHTPCPRHLGMGSRTTGTQPWLLAPSLGVFPDPTWSPSTSFWRLLLCRQLGHLPGALMENRGRLGGLRVPRKWV